MARISLLFSLALVLTIGSVSAHPPSDKKTRKSSCPPTLAGLQTFPSIEISKLIEKKAHFAPNTIKFNALFAICKAYSDHLAAFKVAGVKNVFGLVHAKYDFLTKAMFAAQASVGVQGDLAVKLGKSYTAMAGGFVELEEMIAEISAKYKFNANAKICKSDRAKINKCLIKLKASISVFVKVISLCSIKFSAHKQIGIPLIPGGGFFGAFFKNGLGFGGNLIGFGAHGQVEAGAGVGGNAGVGGKAGAGFGVGGKAGAGFGVGAKGGAHGEAKVGAKGGAHGEAKVGANAGAKAGGKVGVKLGADAGVKLGAHAGAKAGAGFGVEGKARAGFGVGAKGGAHGEAKVGAKGGAHGEAKAGGKVGVKLGADAGVKLGAHAGAKAGAHAGGKIGAKAGAKVGCQNEVKVGANAGGKVGVKLGADAGVKLGAHAGAKAGAHAGGKLGAKAGVHAGANVGGQGEVKVGANGGGKIGGLFGGFLGFGGKVQYDAAGKASIGGGGRFRSLSHRHEKHLN